MGRMRTQIVQGSNLQTAIAQVAQRYRNLSSSITGNSGACHCRGGTGYCIGCRTEAVHHTFSRVKGMLGRDGQPGASVTNPLHSGTAGADGSGGITVRYKNGDKKRYSSRYDLGLVDFDVDDENEDRVFEPGEHIFIRRIRIRNTGDYLILVVLPDG